MSSMLYTRIRKLECDAAGTLSKSTLYLRDAAGTIHSIFEGTASVKVYFGVWGRKSHCSVHHA